MTLHYLITNTFINYKATVRTIIQYNNEIKDKKGILRFSNAGKGKIHIIKKKQKNTLRFNTSMEDQQATSCDHDQMKILQGKENQIWNCKELNIQLNILWRMEGKKKKKHMAYLQCTYQLYAMEILQSPNGLVM